MLSQAQIREGIERMEAVGARNSSDGQAAFQFAEMMEEDRASNPGFSPADHLRNLETSSLALAAGRVPEGLPELGPDILSPAVLEQNQNDLENLGGVIYAFDPRQIEVDAVTFQFKSGGVHELYLKTSLPLPLPEGRGIPQSIGLMTTVNYHTGFLNVDSGWSHATATISTSAPLNDTFTWHSSINYQWSFEDTVNPDDEFWATLGFRASF